MIDSVEKIDPSPENVWLKSLEIIREHVNPRSFQTWFAPLKAIEITTNHITLGVPNKF